MVAQGDQRPVTALIGAGPELGAALAGRFSDGGHHLALVARDGARLQNMAHRFEPARAFAADITDAGAVPNLFNRIAADLGPVTTLIYSTGRMLRGDVLGVAPEEFEGAWRLAAQGLFLAARAVLPAMLEAGHGTIIVIGATASLRGGAEAAAFAPAKAAQRSLTQSMARAYGPGGIHVAHVVIDAVVDGAQARVRMPDRSPEGFASPEAVAASVWHLSQQDPRGWSFELDLRPACESW